MEERTTATAPKQPHEKKNVACVTAAACGRGGWRSSAVLQSEDAGVNRSDRDGFCPRRCESTAASPQLGDLILIPKGFTTRPEVNEGKQSQIKRHTVSSSRPDTRQKLKWQTMVVSRRTRRLVSTPDSRSALDWRAGVSEMGSPAVTRCPSPQSPEAAASSHRCRTKKREATQTHSGPTLLVSSHLLAMVVIQYVRCCPSIALTHRTGQTQVPPLHYRLQHNTAQTTNRILIDAQNSRHLPRVESQ